MGKQDEEVNPYGQVFVGPATSDIELALITAQHAAPALSAEVAEFNEKNSHGLNDVLIKLSGSAAYQAGIDGKVVRYFTVPAGRGQTFDYWSAGREKTRMTSESPWGQWTLAQLYLNGKCVNVRLDNARSQEARPQHLLTAYRKNLGDAPSRLSLERQVPEIQNAAQKSGWKDLRMSIDWAGLEGDPDANRSMGATLVGLEESLKYILSDSMGQEALGAFDKLILTVKKDSTLEISKNGKVLSIAVGIHSGIDHDFDGSGAAKTWITQELEAAI